MIGQTTSVRGKSWAHFLRPGLRFDVVDSGPAEAPAAVLLHGFPQQPSPPSKPLGESAER